MMKGRHKKESYSGDNGHVIHPSKPFDIQSNQSSLLCGAFYPPLLTEFYNKLMANDPEVSVNWANHFNIKSKEGGAFYRYLRFIWNEFNRADSCLDQVFVVQEIENTLMALFAAAVGPNDSSVFPTRQRKADPHHLRRAEEYIEQSLRQPFSLAELSETSGVSIRSLSRKFQERFGMSPMSFVKQRRLEKVRGELRTRAPEEVTVKHIALQYGFHHLSQFAKDYRDMFGESPSTTLQKNKEWRNEDKAGYGSIIQSPGYLPSPSK